MREQPQETALLEIGVEDIPGSYFPEPLEQMQRECESALSAAQLAHERVEVLATPRRLALVMHGLAQTAATREREVKGPPASVAFDAQGKATQAAVGFARSQGVGADCLVRASTEKGEYVFARVREEGKRAEEILPGIWDKVMRSVSFPKTMRWKGPTRFVRPIRWLVAMIGSREVEFAFEGIEAGTESLGHRFISPGPVSIPDASAYRDTLRERGVVVDQDERRDTIRDKAEALAGSVGGMLHDMGGPLQEVSFMCEHPTLFLGKFDPEFLGLPAVVPETIMWKHQRYFAVHDEGGRLLPYFVAVRDGDERNLEGIRAANERVLRARLKDGVFFFRQDMRRKLEERIADLEKITFQEGLGTMKDKAARLAFIVARIGEAAGLDDETKKRCGRAAWLCKVDLGTEMVKELPELQGIVGGEYARLQGESARVAKAVAEHYLPQSAHDALPSTMEGQIVSLADRLDTLCACLSIGLTATGSEDPYGLRRTAQGAARILLEGDLDLSLSPLLGTTFEALAEGGKERMESARAEGEALRSLNQRIQQWLLDQGLPRDVVDAAMGGKADRPREVRERALAVGELLRKDERMAALAVAATRVTNILRSGKAVEELGKHDGGPTEERLQQEAERTLYAICREVERDLSGHGCRVDYGRLLRDLTPLVEPINRFFDDVMVMTEDSELRVNRLALLRQVQSALMRFGDLSRLEMDGATGKWLGGGQ